MTDTDTAPQTAEEVFAQAERDDPQRYAELAARYPINSIYDDQRFRIGEPIDRKRRRDGKLGGPTHKLRYSDEEWLEVQQARRLGLREWETDYAFAKELAQEGM